LTKEQTQSFSQEASQTLSSRGIPVRRGNPGHFVVPKPTGTVRCIILYGCGS